MELTLDWFIATFQQSLLIGLGLFLFFAASTFLSSLWGAPWVITNSTTVQRMLELAELKEGETVYDLGCGDGRMLIQAAQKFGARAIGLEIDPLRVWLSRYFIWLKGLRKSASVRWENIFSADFSDADVVTLYLTRETNRKIRNHLEKTLSPGTRVVSNAFTIPGWTPSKIDNRNLLFMYIIGKTDESTLTQFVEYN